MFGLIFLCTAQLTSFMLIYRVEKIQAFRRYVIHYKVSIFFIIFLSEAQACRIYLHFRKTQSVG